MSYLGNYPIKVKCRECGEEFDSDHPAKKYCGENCRRLQYNKYHKHWQECNPQKVKAYAQKSYDKKAAAKGSKVKPHRQVRIYDGGQNPTPSKANPKASSS